MEHSLTFWILTVIGSVMVGMSKGGLPIVAMLAVPLLSFIMPPATAAGLLLPVYIISDGYGVWLYRRQFSARNLKILIPAAAIGIALGFSTVAFVPGDAVKLAVGGIGLYYLADKLNRRRNPHAPPRPADVPRGLFWGSIAGFTSYISHAGGPPFQAYTLPQQMPKMVFAGTATIMFAVVNLMKVPPYILAGQITWDSFSATLWLAPAALIGAWSGYRLTQILPEKLFFAFVETALFLVSAKLVWDVVAG
ncbi:sulfite exporter TauE/SafE family protein [Psychromarinibacter sp. C21-152]|uniref:Probable membrane transporter protein n=1 Tax=Psychromarinibacter sediminicola TaxID=3033385 RepID=A0AAE3NWE2_9RHOB|nr:sulfite exporter TauE/SafE family protein [Psychromarinibacter sediminicola]MDF0603469.1 sulfite exporter TauE/SafE family protein [Psychromarinibacter sediminicola]